MSATSKPLKTRGEEKAEKARAARSGAKEKPPADEVVAKGVPDEDDGIEEEAPAPSLSGARAATPERAPRKQPSIWQRATYRWVAISAVMAALLIVYTQHPYYKNAQFTPFKTVFPPFFGLWLVFGLFYCKATLEKFSGMRYTVRDSGLHFVLLAKAWQQKRFWRVAKNRRVRTTLLAVIVKAFFTPLMTGFVSGHLTGIARAWLQHKHLAPMEYKVANGTHIFAAAKLWWEHVGSRIGDLLPRVQDLAGLLQPWAWTRADFSWGLGLAYDTIFAIDCGWALFGYASESRWLGNKTRSVEPTAFGWAVCLACYPPYNNVLGTYLPLDNGPAVIVNDDILLGLRAATVFLFSIYAAATVSFGFRFSNLTNRGIVSRGPYKYVRHPAYLTKCTAWWLEHLPTMTLTKAFFLSLLCGVYALRAWTEERHLGMDPDYRAYKSRVRWVLFPGVY